MLDLFSVLFLSQSCSVFVSRDISTVTVLIRGSWELPCCNLCLHSKRTCIIPSSCVALSLDSHTAAVRSVAKSTPTPSCDWFLDMMEQWRTERRWNMQQCLCEVRRLCPRMFDGINQNTPYRWKRSAPRAAPRQEDCALRRKLDTAERAHHAGDLHPVPQRGDDQRPGARLTRRRGTRRPSQLSLCALAG